MNMKNHLNYFLPCLSLVTICIYTAYLGLCEIKYLSEIEFLVKIY